MIHFYFQFIFNEMKYLKLDIIFQVLNNDYIEVYNMLYCIICFTTAINLISKRDR